MRLLLLGLNYAPEPVGIAVYTSGLAEALAERGHEVSVIAGNPYYPQWRLRDGYRQAVTTRRENGVTVTRVPHYIPAEPSGARRIVHHASFAASLYRPALTAAARGADLVFAVAPSLLSVPVAARAARRAGAPLWLHIQDFEVEAAFAMGLMPAQASLSRLASAAERRVLAMADIVSTISPQMCARLAEKGVPRERIVELRNWYNPSFDFTAADDTAYRAQWRLGERHVALYSGNIANKQGLDTVIAAARLLATREDIVFVICGEGPNRARLEDQAQGLGNVQFHGLQPADRMADFLSLASVHLLPQVAGAADLVLPSKLANMLASGRPVVATALSGSGLHAEVEGCGLTTEPGDAAALADAVAQLVADEALRDRLGAQGRARARQRWSRAAIVEQMERRALDLARTGRR